MSSALSLSAARETRLDIADDSSRQVLLIDLIILSVSTLRLYDFNSRVSLEIVVTQRHLCSSSYSKILKLWRFLKLLSSNRILHGLFEFRFFNLVASFSVFFFFYFFSSFPTGLFKIQNLAEKYEGPIFVL